MWKWERDICHWRIFPPWVQQTQITTGGPVGKRDRTPRVVWLLIIFVICQLATTLVSQDTLRFNSMSAEGREFHLESEADCDQEIVDIFVLDIFDHSPFWMWGGLIYLRFRVYKWSRKSRWRFKTITVCPFGLFAASPKVVNLSTPGRHWMEELAAQETGHGDCKE